MTDEPLIDASGDDPSAPQDYDHWLDLDPRVLPQRYDEPRSPQTTDEELIAADELAVLSVHSDAERIRRISAELDYAFALMRPVGHGITVFGSARTMAGSSEYETARTVSRMLGECGQAIITGGGPGAMEGANRGAAEAGARSVGLRIELPFEQGVNEWVDLDVRFKYFFCRKVCFVRYAAAFVVLPGGFGTLDELFETLCLIQTGKVFRRPVVLMDSRFWDGVIDWTQDQLVGRGLISPDDIDLMHVSDDLEEVVRLCCDASAAMVRRPRRRHD